MLTKSLQEILTGSQVILTIYCLNESEDFLQDSLKIVNFAEQMKKQIKRNNHPAKFLNQINDLNTYYGISSPKVDEFEGRLHKNNHLDLHLQNRKN